MVVNNTYFQSNLFLEASTVLLDFLMIKYP